MTGETKRVVNVVIIDDSKMIVNSMRRAYARDPRIRVVGVAYNAEDGRQVVKKTQPDVVTIDVHMPGDDGLTCLQYIMIECPTPCLIVSALVSGDALETFEAYELGAVDVIQKHTGTDQESIERFNRGLIAKVVNASYADVSRVRKFSSGLGSLSTRLASEPAASPIAVSGTVPRQIVVIGISTGGPRTILDVVPVLPSDLGVPVILVQHMPENLTGDFARRLDSCSALTVKEAEDGEMLANNVVYVAPGGRNLKLERVGLGTKAEIRLYGVLSNSINLPSVDVTMSSAFEIFGAGMVGVLMTGMGRDGADSMIRLHQSGGYTVAESEETAVIYGMPAAVVKAGAAREIVPGNRVHEAILRGLRHTRGDEAQKGVAQV
jgi:two-component system, chemotaxis family, protein-glutamate methylesterase/glutaminase